MSSYTNLSSWEWKPSSCLLSLRDVSLITAVWQTGAVCVSQWSCFSSQVTEECDHTERHSGSITTLLIRSLMQGGSVENRVTYQIDTPMNGRDIPSALRLPTLTAMTDQYIPHLNQVPCGDHKHMDKARVYCKTFNGQRSLKWYIFPV